MLSGHRVAVIASGVEQSRPESQGVARGSALLVARVSRRRRPQTRFARNPRQSKTLATGPPAASARRQLTIACSPATVEAGLRFATISIVRSLLAPVPLADRSGHDVDVAGPTPCDRCRTQAVTNPATSHPRARSNAGIDARVAWHLLVAMSATNKAVAAGEGDDRSACRTTRVRRPRGDEVRRAAKAGLRPLPGHDSVVTALLHPYGKGAACDRRGVALASRPQGKTLPARSMLLLGLYERHSSGPGPATA